MPKLLTTYCIFCAAFLLLLTDVTAQTQPTNRTYNVVRTAKPPKIDGKLDEEIWLTHPEQTPDYYTVLEPNNGVPMTQKTLVRIVYDDAGLYIAAKMYDTAPDSIAREMGLRDTPEKNADDFSFCLDAFDSKQNVFTFTVTAAGAQTDIYYTSDNQDINWNAVWQSAVTIDNQGWNAELFLPYSALRFPKKAVQRWNFNFARSIKRNQEFGFWNAVYKNKANIAAQFGTLTGIENIKPPLRLSFFPFLAGYQNTEGGKLIDRKMVGGMDLKIGLNESFTLDMALIPDFGQVRSDDIVLNLTPFEVQYQENRPFFTEGIELFGKGDVFYSRRIGEASYELLEPLKNNEKIRYQPNKTPLLNATKISGRTNKGYGIGFFNAITNKTYAIAQNDSTGAFRDILADPFTNFNVLVADKNLQGGGNIALINTNVYRANGANNANVTATQFAIFNKKSTYQVSGSATLSNKYNLGKNNNDRGYRYNVNLAKVSGKWRGNIMRYVESDRFDPNDLGFLQAANSIINAAGVSYNQFVAGKYLNNFNVSASVTREELYYPNKFSELNLGTNFNAQLKNFWYMGGGYNATPGNSYNFFRPRTVGYFFKTPFSHSVYSYAGTNSNKKLSVNVNAGFWQRPDAAWRQLDNWLGLNVNIRASNKLNFSVGNGWTWNRNERDFVNRLYEGSNLKTVIFGERNNKNIETNANVGYTINKKHSVNTRLRHYWYLVKYDRFFELEKPTGLLLPTNYTGLDANGASRHNQNFNVFTYEFVYNWQFTSASNLSVVYKTNIYGFDRNVDIKYLDNLNTTLNTAGLGSLSFKVIYFLDYVEWHNRLMKKV